MTLFFLNLQNPIAHNIIDNHYYSYYIKKHNGRVNELKKEGD